MDIADRIAGGIAGAMIGDALGALTETLTRGQIRASYGGWISDFVPNEHTPFGQHRTLGAITDDASLLLAMARSCLDGPTLETVVRELLAWSEHPVYGQFCGPSTSRALARIKAGDDPAVVGLGTPESFTGASNGGGMKAAPAGWLHPGDVAAAARTAWLFCVPTHHTDLGVSGAGAIAGACAAAMQAGADVHAVVAGAIEGARVGQEWGRSEGRTVAGPDPVRRLSYAVDLARRAPDVETATDDLADFVGAGIAAMEAVPTAIALVVAADGDPVGTAVAAANIGDDTDTVGCMATAVAGTLRGLGAFPSEWVALVERVNGVDIAAVARAFADRVEAGR